MRYKQNTSWICSINLEVEKESYRRKESSRATLTQRRLDALTRAVIKG